MRIYLNFVKGIIKGDNGSVYSSRVTIETIIYFGSQTYLIIDYIVIVTLVHPTKELLVYIFDGMLWAQNN